MNDYRPFSEREGFVPTKVYQVDIIDSDTRVKIYNQIFDFLHPSHDPYDDDNDRAWRADKLYNWTSTDGGIRHGASSKSLTPDQNTARFMLVICSSFVNYIISRNPQKHGR